MVACTRNPAGKQTMVRAARQAIAAISSTWADTP